MVLGKVKPAIVEEARLSLDAKALKGGVVTVIDFMCGEVPL